MVKGTRMKTVRDFLRWEPLLDDMILERLAEVEKPSKVMGAEVPDSLEGLSLEQLCRLWEIRTTEDVFVIGAEVILGRPRRKVMGADLVPMVGFANWLAKELQRVNDLWGSIPVTHTPEEMMAGVNSLSFGIFGVVDWYARRMSIGNHDDVLATKWVRIFQCMKNDAEEKAYRKRLQDILNNKHKR